MTQIKIAFETKIANIYVQKRQKMLFKGNSAESQK